MRVLAALYFVAFVGVLAVSCRADRDGIPGTSQPDQVDKFGSLSPLVLAPYPNPPADPAVLERAVVFGVPDEGGFDRLVFQFEYRQLPLTEISYGSPADSCIEEVPARSLAGSTLLLIVFRGTRVREESGKPNFDLSTVVQEGSRILDAVYCERDEDLIWIVALDQKTPFRVTTGATSSSEDGAFIQRRVITVDIDR